MKHFASAEFWACLERLPANVQQLARENYDLLKVNPYHPSLHSREWAASGRFGLVARIERSLSMQRAESSGSGSALMQSTIASSNDQRCRAGA